MGCKLFPPVKLRPMKVGFNRNIMGCKCEEYRQMSKYDRGDLIGT